MSWSARRAGQVGAVIGVIDLLSGCGPVGSTRSRTAAKPSAERIAIIASERGPSGGRLVAIDERGDRQFELIQAAATTVRDSNPAVSPDGRWLAFASSRGQPTLETTSLWIAPLAPEAVPVQLTAPRGDGVVDTHPCWTRDGQAIVFASTRAGTFDLWRIAVDRAGRAVGAPRQLTSGPGHEITPTVAADGTIVYAALRQLAGDHVESRLEVRAPDGAIRALTDGPADGTPALSPDDQTIAFARPVVHNGVADAELWLMPRAGGAATALVDLPSTDEGGPVWSRDGRVILATSILRAASGAPMFSAVIHVDREERPAVARILVDHAGAVARLTPAVGPAPLDRGALRGDPRYLDALVEIIRDAVEHRVDAARPAAGAP